MAACRTMQSDRASTTDSQLIFGAGTAKRCVDTRVPRIVVAEDDMELRALMSEVLRSAGYEVVEVADGVHLRERLIYSEIFFEERIDFDLIISDIRMPGLSGFEALSDMRDGAVMPPVILITAFGDQQTFLRASRLGAVAFFDKPIDFDKFCLFVNELIAPKVGDDPASSPVGTTWNVLSQKSNSME